MILLFLIATEYAKKYPQIQIHTNDKFVGLVGEPQ